MAGRRGGSRKNANVSGRSEEVLAEGLRDCNAGESACAGGGWNITAADAALCIEWLAEDGTSLGSSIYHLNSVLEKGLEGRENFLFVAEDAAPDWAFRCLLAMEPMPQRGSYQTGGLLSHLHFQYAPQPEALFDPETKKLRNPMWYATMCKDAKTVLEQCNIVRALHRLPVWEKLPEK